MTTNAVLAFDSPIGTRITQIFHNRHSLTRMKNFETHTWQVRLPPVQCDVRRINNSPRLKTPSAASLRKSHHREEWLRKRFLLWRSYEIQIRTIEIQTPCRIELRLAHLRGVLQSAEFKLPRSDLCLHERRANVRDHGRRVLQPTGATVSMNRTHQIQARAFDAAGNNATATIQVRSN
jgi:hypothetical protein